MFIPLAHENLHGRRLPWVTIAIIVINAVVFLGTYNAMEREAKQSGEAQLHIILVSARYPDAQMTEDAKEVVEAFQRQHPETYNLLTAPDRGPIDGWDAQFLSMQLAPDRADSLMAHLCRDLDKSRQGSILWNYAFHPFHPFLKTYITASFLHGGWLHIISNMWFLWLVGVALEDTWGRVVYPIFYLICGALGFAMHALVFPGSLVPVVGASAAIAGLMGGFLARFPKSKIRIAWILFIKPIKFSVPAYLILPAWLLVEFFWGMIFAATNSEGGVAHWVHVGGFAFGALGALLLKYSGIEHSLDHAIDAKVSWSADPRIVWATDSLAENNAAGAIASLRQLVAEKPDSIEGWEMLLAAQQRRPDHQGQKESLEVLCRLHTAAGDVESAWNDYVEFRNLGGEKVPRGVWLELCRYLESKHDWQGAATEYERLAEQNPNERAGVSALVAAGRIRLTNLHDPERAATLYQAAAVSPAPHSDLDAEIQEGLQRSARAVPATRPGTYSR